MNKQLFIGAGVVLVLGLAGFFFFEGTEDMMSDKMEKEGEAMMEEHGEETMMEDEKNEAMMQNETVDITVTIKNLTEDQPLAPGVYAVHTSKASLDFEGMIAPIALESLAEIGDPTAFGRFIKTLTGVTDVIIQEAPIHPGDSSTFMITVTPGEDVFLSGVQMAVGSNDGYALVDSIALTGKAVRQKAMNYDAGTEQNSALGSGFEGGQPDPSRGAENIENGTATNPATAVTLHTQLTEAIMMVSVE